jgi:hypothetical protein
MSIWISSLRTRFRDFAKGRSYPNVSIAYEKKDRRAYPVMIHLIFLVNNFRINVLSVSIDRSSQRGNIELLIPLLHRHLDHRMLLLVITACDSNTATSFFKHGGNSINFVGIIHSWPRIHCTRVDLVELLNLVRN